MTDPQTTSGQLLPHCSECGVQRHCFDINNNSSVRDGDNMFCVRCGKKTKVSWYAVSHTNRINEEIRMTQPEGQPTTMTWEENFESDVCQSIRHFVWRVDDDGVNGAEEAAKDITKMAASLISNAKEEAEKNMKLELHQTLGRAMRQNGYGEWVITVSPEMAEIFQASLSSNNPKP